MSRVIDFQSVYNIRDLGEIKCKDGEVIKPNYLIRSGSLDLLTEKERIHLKELGIKTVIDLRSPQEIMTKPDKIDSDFRYVSIPIFPTSKSQLNGDYSKLNSKISQGPLSGFQNMVDTYQLMINENFCKQSFHKLIVNVAAALSVGGVLYHCASGKDRTGLATFFLLSLLGVDEETIRKDYLLSNVCSVIKQKEILQAAKKRDVSWAVLSSLRSLSSVADEYLDVAIFEIISQQGNIKNYLKNELQIDESLAKELKEKLLIRS